MEYIMHILVLCGIYALAAVGVSLLSGYAGLLTLGHAGFFALGAYVSAIVSSVYSLPIPISMGLSVVAAASVALLFSLPSLRLRGDYFALATLAFGEIVRSVALNADRLTRGPMGIAGIEPLEFFKGSGPVFSRTSQSAVIVTIVMLIASVSLWRIGNKRAGLVLKAIREDEKGAAALGHDPCLHKRIALCVSAGIVALAGAFYAHYLTFIDPTLAGLPESIFMLCIVVLGGLDSVVGVVTSAYLLIIIPEFIRTLGFNADIDGGIRQILYGVVLVLMMTKFQRHFWFERAR